MDTKTVALLVDGDNIRASFAGQILRKTNDLGEHRIRRAYCNQKSLSDWATASSFMKVHAGSKPNGADILLSVHAMQFALKDGISTFAIASGDRDFSHIAHALRELGCYILGLGTDQAGQEFRKSCSDFIELKKPAAQVATEKLNDIDKTLRKVFEEQDPEGVGIPLNRINSLIRRELPELKISVQPEKTWPRYFKVRTELYTIIGEAPDQRVQITRTPD